MKRALVVVALLVLSGAPAFALAQLVLKDGNVITGVSARRQGDLFLITLKDGSVATIPAASVKELRLVDDPDAPATNIRSTPPAIVAGPPEPVVPPTPSEQVAAFPPTNLVPRRAPVAYEWAPTDGFGGKGTNEFNPARWYRAPIDSSWAPTPAYTYGSDVTNFRPSRWTKVMETIWIPRDGFADAVSNPNRVRSSGTSSAE